MNDSRRKALKKLGLTSGAIWAAPVVTGLVVPQHATATSVSGGSGVDFTSMISVELISPPGVTSNVAIVVSSATDYSGLTASLSIGGVSATFDRVSFVPGPDFTQWEFTAVSVSSGNSYSAVVDGSPYTGTVV